MKRARVLVLLIACCTSLTCLGQDNLADSAFARVSSISNRALHIMDNKYGLLEKLVQRKTEKLLLRMQKKELQLQKKLALTDSTKAKELFTGNIESRYAQLLTDLKSPIDKNIPHPLRQLLPGLDSIQTSLQFLQKNNTKIRFDKLQQMQGVGDKIKQVEGSMQKANDVQQFIKERELQLKQQLANSPLAKDLQSFNKQAYYYQQQLTEYKAALNDPKKAEAKILAAVSKVPAFESFMKKNSLLGQLFSLPEDYGSVASIIGLQTKSQVQQLLGQRFGSIPASGNTGPNAAGYVQQQIQGAQQEIQQLENKVSYLGIGGGGSKDIVMPDFKPNSQKTKSFLKRIEIGSSFTSSQGTSLLPAMEDIGLTAGYKLNDKSVIGVGASYKMGLGKGWNHISISSQGLGLRGFADIKMKGSIWLTGGFEYNYLNAFTSLESLYKLDAWQSSALMGLSKKYKISAKKGGQLQFLYDFLYKQHIPQSQPLVFRLGYSL
jgi:hypothetical protein